MKVNRIFIDRYKNISRQTLDMCQCENYVAFIGLNNAGKSNWLEAISLIFRDMLKIEPCDFEYEVSYEVEGKQYVITKTSSTIDGREKVKSQVCYPSNVIACYSGESLRLWHKSYEKYYMNFFNDAVNNNYEEPKMLYVNRYNWEISLISMMCSDDPEIRGFLKDHFGIDDLSNVIIDFEFEEQNLEKFKDNDVMSFINRIHTSGEQTSHIPMSTIESIDIGANSKIEQCRKLYYFLFLASIPRKNKINKVDRAISKIGISINERSLDDMSEGEKKLILINCVTRVLASSHSILLFDEPDAHVHIANKVQMIEWFRDFKGHIFLTTHSPLFADLLGHDNLKFVNAGEIKEVEKTKRISALSDGFITLVDGAYLITSKNVIVTEGHSDIVYIKRAIELLSEDTPKYNNLKHLSFISQGGANHTKDFYEDTISPIIGTLEKVLFIFDYDRNGQDGASYISSCGSSQIESIYYSDDYSSPNKLFYLEDYFPQESYTGELYAEVQKLFNARKYQEIKQLSFDLGNKVKKTISQKYADYEKAKYQGFRPLLDKLLNVFNL